jgi:hypothetical protein
MREPKGGRVLLLYGLAGALLGILTLQGCGGGTAGAGISPPPPPSLAINGLSAFYPLDAFLSVPYAIAGQGGFQLLLNGTGFTSSSVVEWNGSPLPTAFGDSTDIVATVSSDLIAVPGKATITVVNPGATSNQVEFQIASPATATAGVVQLITAAPDGSPASGDSLVGPSISATGRYVAFQSNATNLAPGPASGYQEIYERDTCIGAPSGCTPGTTRITVTPDGSPVNAHSRTSSVSADGRYVAFDTNATNILPASSACGGTFGDCVFLRDTCTGAPSGCTPTTIPVSVDAQGGIAPGGNPQMSPDARFVAFTSFPPDLGLTGSATVAQVFRRDTCIGAPPGCTPSTTEVSLASDGSQGNERSYLQGISSSGRFVAFASAATNMVPNEGAVFGIFWRDTCLGAPSACTPTTLRADVSNTGAQPNYGEDSDLFIPISADGRFVAFGSGATNLLSINVNANCQAGGPYGCSNLYVRDTCAGAPAGCTPSTSLVSLANDGSLANCSSPGNVGGQSMSADGRFVAFGSIATNLSPDDTFPACGWEDIFVRDTCFGVASGCVPSTVRVSVVNTTNPGGPANSLGDYSAISADGHYVVFVSSATNFLPTPTNGHAMVWLAITGF